MNLRDQLESNKSAAALLRDSEAELARRATPLLDLRPIPRAEWDRYLDRELLVPPEMARWLAGELTDAPPFPMDGPAADRAADAVAHFHGITAPYYVEMSTRLQQTGRAWAHVPECAPFVSGFYFSELKAQSGRNRYAA